jgi:hypothetical protein
VDFNKLNHETEGKEYLEKLDEKKEGFSDIYLHRHLYEDRNRALSQFPMYFACQFRIPKLVPLLQVS